MAIDFVANEGDCWIASGVIPASPVSADTTRIRTGASFANNGWDAMSRMLTPRTEGEVAFRFYNNVAWQNATTPFYWHSSTSVEVVRLRCTSTGQLQLQYWSGSAWVGVGAAVAVAEDIGFRFRLIYSGMGTSSGSITGAVVNISSGETVASWTATGLNLTACPDIARAGINKTFSGTFTVNEYIMSNENLDALLCNSGVCNSTGTDNTGATGTFAAVDEGAGYAASVDDSDLIQLPASGARYSMRMPARNFASRAVRAVVINYRARRGASGPTTIRPYLKIGGTRYYAADQVLTTSFVSGYQAIFNVDPSTGLEWEIAAAQDANLEFGFEAAA